MKAPTKERMQELDGMNLHWLFKQISVGNLVRGFWYVVDALRPTSACVQKCAKTHVEEVKRCWEDAKRENPRASNADPEGTAPEPEEEKP